MFGHEHHPQESPEQAALRRIEQRLAEMVALLEVLVLELQQRSYPRTAGGKIEVK